ncbi:hypothetical protein VSS37_09105 [Candidatus Thiothrix sp. Deng01]|uniref:Uncharacterized protein n=1 Tax=Candidatus Thiothrix phosphatis TaxID=3112415 RepID=A0ABU6CWF2_9GAMM|nr:hypothetical protein [Candidatus Thiothrix sp. Deng01]MEB4591133.1 hypothetical protein [Candidatus Thiothrix sp. Deng01]
MSRKYEQRTIAELVCREGDDLYSGDGVVVQIDSKDGSEFITVKQPGSPFHAIEIDVAGWPMVRSAIDEMWQLCRMKDRPAIVPTINVRLPEEQ